MSNKSDTGMDWPVKRRELVNAMFDSRIWNNFPVREDDIVVATFGKTGTTWTQQIMAQLVSGGDENAPVDTDSPWLDLRVLPQEQMLAHLESLTHRRYIKTHLPLDALAFSPKAKYVCVARDGRDIIWSAHNHLFNSSQSFFDMVNTCEQYPKLDKPPADPVQYFHAIMENDNLSSFIQPMWPYFRGWYAARHLPNVLLVHFNDMKRDLRGEIARIAAFLEIEIKEENWPRILEHCSFEYMKANAGRLMPLAEDFMSGGAAQFIHKGSNGRWKDLLTAEDTAAYEQKAREELGIECAQWLMYGRLRMDNK